MTRYSCEEIQIQEQKTGFALATRPSMTIAKWRLVSYMPFLLNYLFQSASGVNHLEIANQVRWPEAGLARSMWRSAASSPL